MKTSRSLWLWGLMLLFIASCTTAPEPVARSSAMRRESMTASAQQEARPGLGTRWGETRASRVEGTGFRRASSIRPYATAALHYNDAQGIREMIGAASARRERPRLSGRAGSLLSFELRDESGRLLPGVPVGERWFVAGEQGRRYSIRVRNRSAVRLEVLLSVDGLDVIDGRAASFEKRGYVVPPLGTLNVEGFRQSTEAVAAFRFSSVRDSYANRKYGETQNVGVIGVAVFNEYGIDPLDMTEAERRLRADPFPGRRFATPPEPIPVRPPRGR